MRITILGSTGSIGRNTLDVIARHSDRFQVFALTGATQIQLLVEQCLQFQPQYAVVPNEKQALELQQLLRQHATLKTQVLSGEQALVDVSEAAEVDAVMAAIVGAAALRPALAAAYAGKRILLANKEALVVSGALFMKAVQTGGAQLFPVDSEHSAIFQCLPEDRNRWGDVIEKITLTASGGPFRNRDPKTLSTVTPEEACAHPNWAMGKKISVDSATMMNKALEVIEAHWIFNTAPQQIEALIHPESIIHSMVQYRDGSILAQLGVPDMRVPIEVSMVWPERIESGVERLNFIKHPNLTFQHIDFKRFPCLGLAWETLLAPEGSTAILNAANEVAVAAFLERSLRFDQIYEVVSECLSTIDVPNTSKTIDDLFELDGEARTRALQYIKQIS